MSMDGKHRSFREQVEKQLDYRYDVRNEIIINNDTMIFEEEYNVKVLMLNGSAKANGNTYASLLEVGRQLEKEGIEYEIFQMGGEPVRDCLGCGQCTENGCVFADDKVNEFVAKAKEADGFVFGTPVLRSLSTRRKLRKNMVKQQIQGYLFNKSTKYGERRCA